MSILPEGENLRKATKWICEEKEADPEAHLQKLIDAACVKSDLSPRESEFLHSTLFCNQT